MRARVQFHGGDESSYSLHMHMHSLDSQLIDPQGIKDIYKKLVELEANCRNIDEPEDHDTADEVTMLELRNRMGLHVDLLWKHFELLTLLFQPLAPPSLRDLATQYNMPRRLYTHGIRAFLEKFTLLLPQSQGFMITFIGLARIIVYPIRDAVPSFDSVWRECLELLTTYDIRLRLKPPMLYREIATLQLSHRHGSAFQQEWWL